MRDPLYWLLRGLIRTHQLLIRPVIGPRCRFHPGCSRYMLQALDTHGTIRGLGLGIKRLLRCHPLNAGGYDPVPGTDASCDTAANGQAAESPSIRS